MTSRYLLANESALALTLATLGCTSPSGGSEADETTGETGSDGTPFALVSAELDASGQSVILHFSKPVAPVDGVDPSNFRISFAAPTALCGDGGCTDQTTYWDPNFYADDYMGYAPGSGARFEVDMISAGAQASDVSLHFATPLRPSLCEYFAPYEDEYDYLFVHFAAGDIPVESADGEPLAPIGPAFVTEPFYVFVVDGTFPDLDPMISIPCDP